jgi:MFS family permease
MSRVVLGLRENWRQFALLVVVNAFVGAMVGLERTVLPVMAGAEFGITSATAALSFIVTFGLAKAATNLAAGTIVDRGVRRPVLLIGWLLAIPVPLLILFGPSWAWIVAANALLGAQQGLTWSTTVIMKIDLVGPRRRGLAMGLNEFAGYIAVGVAGFLGGVLGATFGGRSALGYGGLAVAVAGFLLSLFVRETARHARAEGVDAGEMVWRPSTRSVVRRSMWADASMFSISQAGLVTNLNDGLAWGVFPLLFVGAGLSLRETGFLTAVYPVTWGLAQLVTGAMSDRWGRKRMIVGGMLVQGASLVAIAEPRGVADRVAALVGLGIGTALVYPTLLAAVGDIAHPSWRGVAVGVYRMWRDLGYVAGALLAGVLTDAFGAPAATKTVGVLTAVSGLVVGVRLRATRPAVFVVPST